MTPKAVVFDIGNVLLDFDYRKTARRIEHLCEIKADDLYNAINGPGLFVDFESGRVNADQFFTDFQSLSSYRGPKEEFADAFGDIFSEVPEMIAFNERLRTRNIPTYILSNTNELSITWIRKRYPFFANFTDYIFSHEHQCMKPCARIYEVVEECSGLRGPDLFYMDDKEENVVAAVARGWQAVHHVSPAQTLEIAGSLGL